MSRGLGEYQRRILEALARHLDRGYEPPLRLLKAELRGTRPRYRLIRRQVVTDGVKLARGNGSNLNRPWPALSGAAWSGSGSSVTAPGAAGMSA